MGCSLFLLLLIYFKPNLLVEVDLSSMEVETWFVGNGGRCFKALWLFLLLATIFLSYSSGF